MKQLLLLLLGFLVFGCTNGLQIDDSASHQIGSYAVGRAMGGAINAASADLDAELTKLWEDFMDDHTDPMIKGEEVVALLNQMSMRAVLHVENPYGLLNDLMAILNAFGANYDSEGNLLSVEDIPRINFVQFGNGYETSRMLFKED
jgi:hypothetical protein